MLLIGDAKKKKSAVSAKMFAEPNECPGGINQELACVFNGGLMVLLFFYEHQAHSHNTLTANYCQMGLY